MTTVEGEFPGDPGRVGDHALKTLVAEELQREKDWQCRDYIAGYLSRRDDEPPPTPEQVAEAEAMAESWWAHKDDPCTRCGRPNFVGQRLNKVGSGEEVCIDCFCFLSGIDHRDPLTDQPIEDQPPRLEEVEEDGEPVTDPPRRDFERPIALAETIFIVVVFAFLLYLASHLPAS